ncbi:hypothetical protein [Actinosynnema sp. NPDC023587]|uniref:hypothetical protein n=1 Tax=Actinosynnema sp. NPDC023587 TaxID=3154695 RepID=UPI003401B172
MSGLTEVRHGTDKEFAGFLTELVRDVAPRLFAIVEEYGDREDAEIAAYGLAFGDRADINSADGDFQMRSQSPESALALFALSAGTIDVSRLHLVWLDGAVVA